MLELGSKGSPGTGDARAYWVFQAPGGCAGLLPAPTQHFLGSEVGTEANVPYSSLSPPFCHPHNSSDFPGIPPAVAWFSAEGCYAQTGPQSCWLPAPSQGLTPGSERGPQSSHGRPRLHDAARALRCRRAPLKPAPHREARKTKISVFRIQLARSRARS